MRKANSFETLPFGDDCDNDDGDSHKKHRYGEVPVTRGTASLKPLL